MADGKWIDGLNGDMSFLAAAARVLRVRLAAVAERLPFAVYHAADDVEHVHQLRVSTRRAGAAVRIFGECLPSKERKAISKVLKRIRRAAGGARDWDVFQDAIAERLARSPAATKPGLDFLIGFGQGQRTAAQTSLAELDSLASGGFLERMTATLASLRDATNEDVDEDASSFRSQARPLMTTLLQELDAAVAQDLNDYDRLHQVRIVGKQLRYAMEIFADCFAAEFRDDVYPAIEEMQEILGLANDSHVAVHRLTEIRDRLEKTHPRAWRRCRAGIEWLATTHQRRLPEQRRAFLRWWKKWRSAGLEHRLEEMLR